MKRIAGAVVGVLAVVSGVAATPGAATDSGPYCGLWWGSLPVVDEDYSAAEVVGIRAGRHRCFDRLVIDLGGDVAGYRVQYVDELRQSGSGLVVPVRGGARLQVTVTAPVAVGDERFHFPNPELVDVARFRTFRQVAWVDSFESLTTIGLGVRARLPFRVFTLDGPGEGSRLVIDVAHRW